MLQVRLIQAVTSDIKADPEDSGLLQVYELGQALWLYLGAQAGWVWLPAILVTRVAAPVLTLTT